MVKYLRVEIPFNMFSMQTKFFQYYNKVISFVLKMLGFSSTFVLAACYGPPPRDFELDVFPGHLDFLADGEEAKSFQIMTEGRWSITQIPSFVSVSSTSGKGSASVQVSVLSNYSTTSRTDMIVIHGESDEPEYVTVTQQGTAPQFSVSPQSLYLSSVAGMAQT